MFEKQEDVQTSMKRKLHVFQQDLEEARSKVQKFHDFTHAWSELQQSALAVAHRAQDKEPFILFLIDGDNTLFLDKYLSRGHQGGREAARDLAHEIECFLHRDSSLCLEWKIVVRIYWNLRGLSKVFTRLRLGESDTLRAFCRAFNKERPLFECIDAGDDKEAADTKIRANFELHWHNSNCKQIVLAASGDRGYVAFLRQYVPYAGQPTRLTLLEALPFSADFACLSKRFRCIQFSVFRRERLFPETRPLPRTRAFDKQDPQLDNGNTSSARQPPATTEVNKSQSHDAKTPPLRQLASAAPTHGATGRDVECNTTKSEVPASTIATSPAAQDAAADPGQSPLSVIKLRYNIRNQRIDVTPADVPYDKAGLRSRKLCNRFYLSKCANRQCGRNHDSELDAEELRVLEVYAKCLPCRTLYCSDPTCVSGHQCPNGQACRSQQSCKFSEVMHSVDTNIVRVETFSRRSLVCLSISTEVEKPPKDRTDTMPASPQ
ncbi:hypothetical protein AMS68_002024 [Peltaster fructicola]|uniref:C3H1-type domain-containing protein n=1 Tax=Peltaster fructicola TaxID=286661 RepID=A0A6H0XP21_9PEZI|nr:hypothetical protein AMS68_002024 [Peltaster fructicola]